MSWRQSVCSGGSKMAPSHAGHLDGQARGWAQPGPSPSARSFKASPCSFSRMIGNSPSHVEVHSSKRPLSRNCQFSSRFSPKLTSRHSCCVPLVKVVTGQPGFKGNGNRKTITEFAATTSIKSTTSVKTCFFAFKSWDYITPNYILSYIP